MKKKYDIVESELEVKDILRYIYCFQKVIIIDHKKKHTTIEGTFRTHSNICDGAFLLVKGF